MPPISSIGKYLDQPLLTAKFNKNIPAILTLASGAVLAKETHNATPKKRKKAAIKNAIILTSTVISALSAPKIAAYITRRQGMKSLSELKNYNTQIINEYFAKNKITGNIQKILKKAKNEVLSLKDIHELFNSKEHKTFAGKLIPPPENIKAKDIFKEIGWLSIYGAIPVAGGLTGGIIADRITEKNWKEKIPNKVNEGLYQYLANIFLCNIGAGAALGILEKMNIKSKSARCAGMIGGILLTGVIGGSAIANYIAKKVVNPLMKNNTKNETRTPELLDLGLHIDDITTVSLLSGLKWIEPSLPLLYSTSGYRAGIGYRNNKHDRNSHEKQTHFLRTKC